MHLAGLNCVLEAIRVCTSELICSSSLASLFELAAAFLWSIRRSSFDVSRVDCFGLEVADNDKADALMEVVGCDMILGPCRRKMCAVLNCANDEAGLQ